MMMTNSACASSAKSPNRPRIDAPAAQQGQHDDDQQRIVGDLLDRWSPVHCMLGRPVAHGDARYKGHQSARWTTVMIKSATGSEKSSPRPAPPIIKLATSGKVMLPMSSQHHLQRGGGGQIAFGGHHKLGAQRGPRNRPPAAASRYRTPSPG